MTLHASRDGQRITIGGNLGVDMEIKDSRVWFVRITEDAQHVRSFWHRLGELLNAADQERQVPAEPGGATLTRDEKAAEVATFLTGG